MSEITAKARVHVTLEVDTAAWGEESTIGQLYKQAAEDALTTVRHVLKNSQLRIIGEPRVIGIITEKNNKEAL